MRRAIGFIFSTLTALILLQILTPRLEAQFRIPGRNNQPRNGVCFYTDAEYRGESLCVNSNESRPSVGNFNDRISSIRIFGNAEVTVYEDSNFRGSRETFTQDMPHLGDWNDRISSFQANPGRQYGQQRGRLGGRNRTPGNGACFYVDANFRGDNFCMEAGDSQRELPGEFNDRISSIQVFGRAQVTVYEDNGFHGARRTYNRNVSNLSGDFNDTISSIEVR